MVRLKLALLWVLAALLAACAAMPAPDDAGAREATAASSGAEIPLSVQGGLGFTLDPDTFLMAARADYWVRPNVAVGPLLQVGLADHRTILAPSFNVKGVFDLKQPSAERLKPYIDGGVGFAYLEKDGRRGDDDDLGVLLDIGGGLSYDVNDHLAVGTGVLFNFLPAELVGERFFFSWQLVTLSFRF
ncbi:MAG: hypothetical protein U1E76_12310 [Planctomycetota bacterium]